MDSRQEARIQESIEQNVTDVHHPLWTRRADPWTRTGHLGGMPYGDAVALVAGSREGMAPMPQADALIQAPPYEVTEFVKLLQRLRQQAGDPTVRQLALATNLGRSTIGDAFKGRRMPTWETAKAHGQYFGYNLEELRRRWTGARKTQQPRGVTDWTWLIDTTGTSAHEGRSLARLIAEYADDPAKLIEVSWFELNQFVKFRVASIMYGENLNSGWSGDVEMVVERLVDDGHLHPTAREATRTLMNAQMDAGLSGAADPSEAIKYVVLSRRIIGHLMQMPRLLRALEDAEQRLRDERDKNLVLIRIADDIRESRQWIDPAAYATALDLTVSRVDDVIQLLQRQELIGGITHDDNMWIIGWITPKGRQRLTGTGIITPHTNAIEHATVADDMLD